MTCRLRDLTADCACPGYAQRADTPGRHEPGTGEIGWEYVFGRVDELGYAGWIGCEYKPATTTEAGLGWLQQHA